MLLDRIEHAVVAVLEFPWSDGIRSQLLSSVIFHIWAAMQMSTDGIQDDSLLKHLEPFDVVLCTGGDNNRKSHLRRIN